MIEMIERRPGDPEARKSTPLRKDPWTTRAPRPIHPDNTWPI